MMCRFLHISGGVLLGASVIFLIMPMTAVCQAPGYPQAQPAPVYPQPAPGQPVQPTAPPSALQQPMPAEYAFRGDLTNDQYGECLGLERTWQANWHRYAYEYQRAMMVSNKDPIYPQITWYVQGIKQQLDQSWNAFSSKCIYFPPTRQ